MRVVLAGPAASACFAAASEAAGAALVRTAGAGCCCESREGAGQWLRLGDVLALLTLAVAAAGGGGGGGALQAAAGPTFDVSAGLLGCAWCKILPLPLLQAAPLLGL